MEDFDKKIEQFLIKFSDAIDLEDCSLNQDSKLEDIPWDSLAIITAISLIDEIFDKVISTDGLSKCITIRDVILLTQK